MAVTIVVNDGFTVVDVDLVVKVVDAVVSAVARQGRKGRLPLPKKI